MRSISLALFLLAGCVGKGRHELVEVQLDATRTALSARQAACQEDVSRLQQANQTVTAELAAERARLAELTEHLAGTEGELATLRTEQARWIQQQVEPTAPTEPPATPPSLDLLTSALTLAGDERLEAARIERHHAEVHAAFADLVAAGRLSVVHERERAIVRIGVNVLFQEGKVVLSPLGDSVLEQVAAALGKLPDRKLSIDGHTDDRPHHSVQHGSNWELGFNRAVQVLRALEAYHVALRPAAASYADTAPAVPHDAPGAPKINARIELVLTPAQRAAAAASPHPVDADG